MIDWGKTLIDNTADVIDSREVEERIVELVDAHQLAIDTDDNFNDDFTRDDYKELLALTNLRHEYCESEGWGPDSEWDDGVTFIRYDNTEYFEQLTRDSWHESFKALDELPDFLKNNIEFDWDAIVNEMLTDYTEIKFDGVTYYYR